MYKHKCTVRVHSDFHSLLVIITLALVYSFKFCLYRMRECNTWICVEESFIYIRKYTLVGYARGYM